MSNKTPPITKSLGFGIIAKPKTARGSAVDASPAGERKPRILLVDPDPESRRLMHLRLTAANYRVDIADSGAAALDLCVRARPNVVITDLRLGAMGGLELLIELTSRWPAIIVIIITAHATIPDAVRATQAGAFSFLVQPVEKAELLGQVRRAITASTFELVEGDWRAKIVARSQLMEERLEQANRAAGSNAPILLNGENGTGKELFARAIHAASPRRGQPFVAVHCRDTDEERLKSELFGGADNAPGSGAAPCADALAPRKGALERANGGSLFLDEVGCLTVRLQLALLAALRAEPLGVRLICSSSLDLGALLRAGQIREELFYHINVFPIEIPPLGRRREDIPLLVSHFLEQATEPGESRKIYSPEAIELLVTTDWPGNVRQLFDLVKKNVALSHNNVMSKEFVQRSLGPATHKVLTYDEARDNFARNYLTTNLQAAAGNISRAARLAKRNRTDFYKLLARYRVEVGDFKTDGQTSESPPAPPLEE
jgi:two-component system response regulator GlrR